MAVLADEDVLLHMVAHLLSIDSDLCAELSSEDGSAAWQEQGSGIVHFVQSRHDSSVRVMMHHAWAPAHILLNHPVTHPSQRNLVTRVPMHRAPARASGGEADLFCAYLAADYSRGRQENRLVALRFDTAHTAKEFERMLDSCLHGAAHSRGPAPPQPVSLCTHACKQTSKLLSKCVPACTQAGKHARKQASKQASMHAYRHAYTRRNSLQRPASKAAATGSFSSKATEASGITATCLLLRLPATW